MQSQIKRFMRARLTRSPLPEIALRRRSRRHLTVLAYHRIGELPDADYPFDAELFSATPEEFRRELAYVRRHLDVISMSELSGALRTAQQRESVVTNFLPPRPAVITFDDGYRDNAEIALPLLREAGLSACFFLTTRFVGTDAIPWWDQAACCFKFSRASTVPSPFGADDAPYNCANDERNASIQRFLHNLKRVPWPDALNALAELRGQTRVCPQDYAFAPLFMDWNAARELAAQGMDIGGHTRTHPILSNVENENDLWEEIGGCSEDIREQSGCAPLAFAYPVGGEAMMSAPADETIRQAGFALSFSYEHGVAQRIPASPWRLPRVHAEHGEDFGAFRLELARVPLRQVIV